MARLIKRYENRKLYDTEASAYVSQVDIARLVRSGETVKVVDNVSGEDITAHVLTQIMLEEGKQGDDFLPTELLHDLLRKGGEAAASSLEQLRHSVDDLVQHSMDRLSGLVGGTKSTDVKKMRKQIEELEAQLGRVIEAIEERESKQNSDAGGNSRESASSHASSAQSTNRET